MSTVRPGHRPVLLVVDVQVGVVADAWEAPRVVANVARAVQRARDGGVPVIWVQHQGDDLPRDSTAWQLAPELVPMDGDGRIDKRFESSFEETGLEDLLAKAGATHLVLAGAMTNWCIRATAYAALDRGYDLTLLDDAHTTAPIDLGGGATVDAAGIVADLNIAMTWLRYPGRTNTTSSVDAMDFATSPTA